MCADDGQKNPSYTLSLLIGGGDLDGSQVTEGVEDDDEIPIII